MPDSQQESLVPITITSGMVGRTLITTRGTAASMKSKPDVAVVRHDAVAAPGAGTKCPCCNQPVDIPSVEMIVDEWGLSPLQARILEAVWKGKGHPVATETIYLSMYRDDPDGGPPEGKMYLNFKVALHYMRRLLNGSGIGIKTVGYRRGYKLVITERTETGKPDQSRRSWNLRTQKNRTVPRPNLIEIAARDDQAFAEKIELAEKRYLDRLAKDQNNAEALTVMRKRLQKAESGRQLLLKRLAEEKHLRRLAEDRASKEPDPVEKHPNGCAKMARRTLSGELNPNAKISNDQASEIRAEYAANKPRQRDLAMRYGVSQRTIGKIVNGVSFQNATQISADADHASILEAI